MKLKFNFGEIKGFTNRLGDSNKLSRHFKAMVREMAKVMREMLKMNTPVKTGRLRSGWDAGQRYTVRQNKQGFSVTLYNRVPYARYVNDGHYSYNQYNVGGDPYTVKHRTVKYTRGNSSATFVYGHFFIEKAVVEMENNFDILSNIFGDELEKWFAWSLNGK